MTLGRLATFAAILAASAAVAGTLVRRHHEGVGARFFEHSRRTPEPLASSAPRVPAARTPPIAVAGRLPEQMGGPEAVGSTGAVEDPLTEALCPLGMLLVEGTTCGARRGRCSEAGAAPAACLRFEPAECRRGQALRFCMDRFEYPNLEGVVPATMVTFEQARSACNEEDKRLCNETEWRFACEGREGFELPYGNAWDAQACNAGRRAEAVRPEELWEPRDVSRVLARVDRRVPSGSMKRCSSPFGVRDTTGNVEEWGTGASGIEAALLGGDSLQPEPLCRTVRKTRQTALRTPHAGFRCCRDPLIAGLARPSAGP